MPENSQQPTYNPNGPPNYNTQPYHPPQRQGYPSGQNRQASPNQGYPPQNYQHQQGQPRFNQPGSTVYVERGSPRRYRDRRGSGGSGIGNFATGMLVGGALGGGRKYNIF